MTTLPRIRAEYCIPYISKEKPGGEIRFTYDKASSAITNLIVAYHYDKDKGLPGLTPENASEILNELYKHYTDSKTDDDVELSITIDVSYLHSVARVFIQRGYEPQHSERFELEEDNGYFTIKEDKESD